MINAKQKSLVKFLDKYNKKSCIWATGLNKTFCLILIEISINS